jgi:hypothetical protein
MTGPRAGLRCGTLASVGREGQPNSSGMVVLRSRWANILGARPEEVRWDVTGNSFGSQGQERRRLRGATILMDRRAS